MNAICVGALSAVIRTEKGGLFFDEFWFLVMNYQTVISCVFIIVIA
jgi:hypothetical protein